MVCARDALRAWVLSALVVHGAVAGNPDAKRLYDDLLSNYNKLVRPVVNTSDVLRVCIKLKLSQLIDVVRWLDILSRSFKADLQIVIALHGVKITKLSFVINAVKRHVSLLVALIDFHLHGVSPHQVDVAVRIVSKQSVTGDMVLYFKIKIFAYFYEIS